MKLMKVIFIGPRGKMGRLITQSVAKKNDLTLAAAIAPKGRDYIGEDLVIIPCVPVIF
jgi:4-hydroxy-tetrahydrodipicolinate reductase